MTTYLAFYIANSRENPRVRFWDKLVSKIDGSPYSHVELAVSTDNGDYDCYSSSARDGGVRHKRMLLDDKNWLLVPLYLDLEKAMLVFNTCNGQGYDWLGLGSTKWRWFPNIPNRKFCSEICAEMLGIVDSSNYGVKRLYDWALAANSTQTKKT